MAPPPPPDRVYDEKTGQWCRWSQSRGCWVGENDGKAIRTPQTSKGGTSGTTKSGSKPTGSSSKATSTEPASKQPSTSGATKAMSSLTVGSPPTQSAQGGVATGGRQVYDTHPPGASYGASSNEGSSYRTTSAYPSYPAAPLDQKKASQSAGPTPSTETQRQRSAAQSTQQGSTGGQGRGQDTTNPNSKAPAQNIGGRSTGQDATGPNSKTSSQNIGSGTVGRTAQNVSSAQNQRAVSALPGQGYNAPTPTYGASLPTQTLVAQGGQLRAGNRQAAPYNVLSTEPRTGSRTQWKVTGTTEYTDPQNRTTNRILNLKQVSLVDDRSSRPNRPNESDFGFGRVIEVLFPESIDLDSNITPTQTETVESSEIRLRRFVVIRRTAERRVETIAIKTYWGRGVSAPGVIKSHHSIIYTGQRPAQPLPGELVGRGGPEHGMQPQHIKVVSDDRGKALDPMSRLDYADRTDFDLNVSNIRTFGRVHSDSLAALSVQYNSVWSTIRTAVLGPSYGPTSAYARSSTLTATGLSIPPLIPRTGPTRPADLLRLFAPRSSGPCTVEDMTAIIRYLQNHAVRHRMQPPVVSSSQMQDLARNPGQRADYIQLIRDTWHAAQGGNEEEESSDEESSDEESEEEETSTSRQRR